MRLIGSIEGDKEAYKFSIFLQKEGIDCSYEPVPGVQQVFHFWVVHEEELESALHWLQEFKKNPGDSRFKTLSHPIDTKGIASYKKEKKKEIPLKILKMRHMQRAKMPLTRLIIIVCAILFIWNGYQLSDLTKKKSGARFLTLTPIFMSLSYDSQNTFNAMIEFFEKYPMESPEELEKLPPEMQSAYKKIESIPTWIGLYGIMLGWPESKQDLHAPMFIKLQEGQLWRLFTPCLLHGGFLHILFNMLWLWMLGKQVEERVKKWQYISITLIIGVVSNTFQYLMSGPLFIGYSGIICGLAGFIWMRQIRAPWEGYPLQKGTLIFLGVFIFGMVVLQAISFIFMHFQVANFPMNIANTAHISGAITGAILGRIPIFTKGSV